MSKTFRLMIEGAVDLPVSALWPDGDAPSDPTPGDVCALVERCGGLLKVIEDWNLEPKFKLPVTPLRAGITPVREQAASRGEPVPVGKTANELRDFGYQLDDDVPGHAVLMEVAESPTGYAWVLEAMQSAYASGLYVGGKRGSGLYPEGG